MQKTSINHKIIKQALLIRKVEQTFLDLFSQGKLNGTVHTCVGQEFSALAFAGQLKRSDFVFSNHRCHGHYIAFTRDFKGLMAELMGKAKGTCGGVGSSQHLCRNNFYSNGIQGGIVPVAAGYALANKLQGNDNIGLVYIGDGTLGEGVLYETMNIASKWSIPLLIVCENNFYAQSTPQDVNLAGDICQRAEAFGIKTYRADTWDPENLMAEAKNAINYVRESFKPAFFLVETYRLNAHSKGDDDRDEAEVEDYRKRDFLIRFEKESPEYYQKYQSSIDQEVDTYVAEILDAPELQLEEYYPNVRQGQNTNWSPLPMVKKRMVERLNTFFKDTMAAEPNTVFMGEDVLSPYGGAFKVARDLSDRFAERVFSTPISEAAITGIGNGLALNGMKPYVEIMFGDFVTLAMDQIVNHASKFHHMFLHQVNCPVVVRTPMGGRRGYGPTHSQTLDKFLIGIDNVKTIALSPLLDPYPVLEAIQREEHPVILIENKVDYGKRIATQRHPNFTYELDDARYPIVRIKPAASATDITLVAYGGMAELTHQILPQIFRETDQKPELIVLSQISPLPLQALLDSVAKTQQLIVLEEGSPSGGVGGEIIASVVENSKVPIRAKRIAALPVPIPSVKSLEGEVLPSPDRIIAEIQQWT
ncbi:MAG: thiamine pyrophosphate-dependent enzyme [Bacteroidota bacterium]